MLNHSTYLTNVKRGHMVYDIYNEITSKYSALIKKNITSICPIIQCVLNDHFDFLLLINFVQHKKVTVGINSPVLIFLNGWPKILNERKKDESLNIEWKLRPKSPIGKRCKIFRNQFDNKNIYLVI